MKAKVRYNNSTQDFEAIMPKEKKAHRHIFWKMLTDEVLEGMEKLGYDTKTLKIECKFKGKE